MLRVWQAVAWCVVDRLLRPLKARAYAKLARNLRPLSPDWVTLVALLVGLSAAAAAAAGEFPVALGLWWLNRFLDGLDGELARVQAHPSRHGGYLDLMLDLVVYAALPLGIAAGASGLGVAAPAALWLAAGCALAAFYLNLGSWALLAPSLPAEPVLPHQPGLRMPVGLMEGTETLIAFTVALAFPSMTLTTLNLIAGLTALSALQRSVWGIRYLKGAR